MKFGALLRESSQQTPSVSQLFETYKKLKKRIKALPQVETLNGDHRVATVREGQEQQFVEQSCASIKRLNKIMLANEEQLSMRLVQLETQRAEPYVTLGVRSTAEAAGAHQVIDELCDFHGDVTILAHWSFLAYSGTCKILKKFTKRTGQDWNSIPSILEELEQHQTLTVAMTQYPQKVLEVIGKVMKAYEDFMHDPSKEQHPSLVDCCINGQQSVDEHESSQSAHKLDEKPGDDMGIEDSVLCDAEDSGERADSESEVEEGACVRGGSWCASSSSSLQAQCAGALQALQKLMEDRRSVHNNPRLPTKHQLVQAMHDTDDAPAKRARQS